MNKLKLLILLSIVFAPFIFSHGVNAEVSNVFPNGDHVTGGSVKAVVARDPNPNNDYDGVTLNSPVSRFEISLPKTSGDLVDITVVDACAYSDGGGSYRDIEASVPSGRTTNATGANPKTNGGGTWSGDQGHCSNGDLKFNNVRVSPDNDYGDELKTVVLTVSKPSSGIKFFEVRVGGNDTDGAKVSFKNDAVFGLWGFSSNYPNGNTDISFKFKPDCTLKKTGPVAFRWFDADQGEPNQGSGMYFTVKDLNTDSNIATVHSLGGNNDSGSIVRNINPKHTYVWTWHNIGDKNGLQVQLPFTENSGGCPEKPKPVNEYLGLCSTTVHFTIPADTSSTNYAVHVRVYARTSSDGNPFDEPKVYDAIHGETAGIDLKNKVGLDKLQSNNGFWVLTKPSVKKTDSNGNEYWDDYGPNQEDAGNGYRNWGSGPCFDATCEISVDSNVPGDPSGGVQASQWYQVTYTIRNRRAEPMPNPLTGTSNYLAVTGSAGVVGNFPSPYGIEGNDYESVTTAFVAPPGVTSFQLSGYPDYYGKFGIGALCATTVNVYREYQVDPIATINNADNENPTAIDYTTGGNMGAPNPGINVILPTSSSIYVASDAGCTNVLRTVRNNNDGSPSYGNVLIPNPPATRVETGLARPAIAPGEFYCVGTTIPSGHGWVGPPVNGGASSNVVALNATSNRIGNRVVNKPYVRFYGQDVYAGGRFSGGGAVTSNGIKTNHRSTGAGGIGSGVEYAAHSIGAITQDSSRNLGFAQNSLKAVVSYPAGIGGDHVATDYYAKLPINATGFSGVLNTPGDEAMKSGNTTIQASQIPLNSSKTLYVDGDVVIAGNITYADWGNNINAIPHFKLVVKGNIYITSNVTRIDGLLVAQPNGANTGRIHTCISTDGSPALLDSNGTTFGECNAQLVINGAVVAQKIFWQRTGWTLSNALSGGREPYNNNRAAEVINASPDFYLGVPADPADGGGTSGKYDSYQALPPIL